MVKTIIYVNIDFNHFCFLINLVNFTQGVQEYRSDFSLLIMNSEL